MKFKYEAVTGQGDLLQETLVAQSREEAALKVQRMGYFPITISEVGGEVPAHRVEGDTAKRPFWKKPLPFRIPFKEVIYFTRRLATLHEAGLSVTRSLTILKRQFSRSRMGVMVDGMLQAVEEGGTLASAFAKYPRYFDTFYVSIIQAGEYGGNLEESLRRLANELEKVLRRRKKLTSAMIYPVIIVIVAFALVMIINVFVIPMFRRIYEDANISLPQLTVLVLTANEWILSNGFWILLGFLLFSVVSKLFLRNWKIRYGYHFLLLKIPVLGPIVKKHSLSWFFRSLGTMLNSGIGIIDSLNIVLKIVKIEVFRKGIEKISREIYEGKGIATAMEKLPFFDPYSISMVEVGEQSGRLTQMLFSIADSYEEDLDTAYERLEAAFTPAVTVVLAVVVGFIVVALFLPYLNYIQELTSGNLF